ncbi:hypothetical protein H6G17_09675 [Chroococcidiopsis sp. FACHB-1243]|uniref:hypothetical protein n=1 Tax=Chroococcidiopsis sp. [FACHB-1243] TaxID=2692781 RepID=UPI00177AEE4B|nr:hypothetical protein [Chroococcidiopsis sp. [FACHB-1243]]MBD2305779.1 hypothetical protein [Chroococcidiopsis sp. [FACHB-1243]]
MFFISNLSLVIRPLLVCIACLILYQSSIFYGFLPSSEGINQWQANIIKAEKYIYNQSSTPIVLVGSSLANNLPIKYFSNRATNLGMSGGSTQTGLEIVRRKDIKPRLLLVELNDTIGRKLDTKLVNPLFHPLTSFIKIHFPMFRQEYRPTSVLMQYLENEYKQRNARDVERQDEQQVINSDFRKKMIEQLVEDRNIELDIQQKQLIIKEAEFIKNQIADIQKEAVRVILFDIPGEPVVDNTTKQKQIRELLKSLFPKNSFEWLPELPAGKWITSDGIHLVQSNAKEYVSQLDRIINKLLNESHD